MKMLTLASTSVFAQAPSGSTRDSDRLQTPSGDPNVDIRGRGYVVAPKYGRRLRRAGCDAVDRLAWAPELRTRPAVLPPTAGTTNPGATPGTSGSSPERFGLVRRCRCDRIRIDMPRLGRAAGTGVQAGSSSGAGGAGAAAANDGTARLKSQRTHNNGRGTTTRRPQ